MLGGWKPSGWRGMDAAGVSFGGGAVVAESAFGEAAKATSGKTSARSAADRRKVGTGVRFAESMWLLCGGEVGVCNR